VTVVETRKVIFDGMTDNNDLIPAEMAFNNNADAKDAADPAVPRVSDLGDADAAEIGEARFSALCLTSGKQMSENNRAAKIVENTAAAPPLSVDTP
jgi:hypothetical protein